MKEKRNILIILCVVLTFLCLYLIINNLNNSKIEIIIENKQNTLKVNNSMTLIASVKGGNSSKIIWASSNLRIAEITRDGILTGKSVGKTTISAIYLDNNNNKISDSFEISIYDGDPNISLNNISFASNKVGININGVYKLPLVIEPNNAYLNDIQYTSSNPDCVLVENDGTIKGLNFGKSLISISANDNKFSDTIEIIVSDEYLKPTLIDEPTYIKFSEERVKLEIGETYNIKYEISSLNTPSTSLKWESSNENVAVVKDGKVTAIGIGKCSIVGTTINNLTAKMIIEVAEKEIMVEEISLLPSSMLLKVGDRDTIVSNIAPSNANNKKLTYDIDNPIIASVDQNGKVTALSEGSAIVTVTSSNNVKKQLIVNVVSNQIYNENIDNINQNSENISLVLKSSSGTIRGNYNNLTNSNQNITIGISSVIGVNGIQKVEYCVYKYGENECNKFTQINDINSTFYVLNSTGEYVIRMKVTDKKNGVIYKNYYAKVNNFIVNDNPSGKIDSTCGNEAQTLIAYVNGKKIERYEKFTISKGEKLTINLYLTKKCGTIKQLARNTPDGEENWRNYFNAVSVPFVDRYNPATFVNQDNFDWVIEGIKSTNGRYIHLSQTTFQSTNKFSEIKSFFNVYVKVID